MRKPQKPLSDEVIGSLLPGEKPAKFFAGGGLFLLVTVGGSKLWRFRYRYQGKEKLISFGTYPEISLDRARMLQYEAKKLLKNGLDPSGERKMEKLSEKGIDHTVGNTSVRICNDGVVEIWKGRIAVRLTLDEACFVKDQLSKLIS